MFERSPSHCSALSSPSYQPEPHWRERESPYVAKVGDNLSINTTTWYPNASTQENKTWGRYCTLKHCSVDSGWHRCCSSSPCRLSGVPGASKVGGAWQATPSVRAKDGLSQ